MMERLITARMENRSPIPTFQRSIIPSEALRLIDQHDGNVVFDGVHQAAGVTGKRFRIRPMLERDRKSELQSLTNLVCRLLLEKKKYHRDHRAQHAHGAAGLSHR